jgi:hypothetical protein
MSSKPKDTKKKMPQLAGPGAPLRRSARRVAAQRAVAASAAGVRVAARGRGARCGVRGAASAWHAAHTLRGAAALRGR